MPTNQRDSYRVDPHDDLEAHLAFAGAVTPCRVLDVSAGGARVVTAAGIEAGSRCTMLVRQRADDATPQPQWLRLPMVVIESLPARPGVSPDNVTADGTGGGTGTGTTDAANAHVGDHVLRMRSLEPPGSPTYEAAVKLVFDAQRRARSRDAGTGDASPMATDSERRGQMSASRSRRFGRDSLRPDRD